MPAGPYIVTVKRSSTVERPPGSQEWASITRCAVATLDEVREAYGAARGRAGLHGPFGFGVPAEGGTFGPLSDGTVIEVECVEWGYLLHAWIAHIRRTATNAEIIAAYNEAQ